jgi:hypothetical protein
MRLLTVLVASCLVTGGLAGPSAAASGYLYDCDMADAVSSRGWISPKVAVVVPGDGTVKVVDALILYFNKEPIEATVLRDNEKRLIVKWTLDNAKSDSGTSFANFDYRASIAKGSGKIELTATPRNFDTGMRSGGTCRKRAE